MANLICLSSTPFSKSYAKKHNLNELIVLQKIDSWQLAQGKRRDELPTETELESFMERQKKEEQNFSFSLMLQLAQDVNMGKVAKVKYHNKDYYVTGNGTIIDTTTGKIKNFSDDDFYNIMELAPGTLFESKMGEAA